MEKKVYETSLFEPERASNKQAERLKRPSVSYWADAFRRFRANKIAMGAFILLCIIIIMAIFVPVFSRYTYQEQDYLSVNQPPSMTHLFGTDDLGRDIFVRCWEGARVSLFIAVVIAILNSTIGIIYGGIAGYSGGKLDNLMMRICEIIAAIPQMLWVILLILVMKPGVLPVIIAISATGWISMARLFRGQVFQIKEMEFVMSSKTLGAGDFWIIRRHLVPNAMSPIIANMAFVIPGAIFAEAFLSYIGLGLPLPMASWGTLASDGAAKIFIYPYQLFFPALLISLTMLSFNLMGDGLRDALDPRLRD
ncbi:ABC transporter permease [Acidaminobacter sp. JC074]|uniref:ABC transporter permease n=1 Tax=Acidaminobacter sp. JC074 TaxID=2530199 RepID=UPI001F0FDBE2|nr:ABC transporter permease [Acidaminobacter sp. JC074]MCH4886350.1 ABC transporter permease [Acidaminobacter sp. JC074]